jgi:CelD/BcsL family acetyltransferase involved in cellulose biosynthesis
MRRFRADRFKELSAHDVAADDSIFLFYQNSASLLATEDAIRECINMGLSTFDFTIGDHSYKLQCGGKKSPLFEWHIPRTARGHLGAAVLEGLREVKRTLKPWLKKDAHWGSPEGIPRLVDRCLGSLRKRSR